MSSYDIQRERLAEIFTRLCETESPSRQEKDVSLLLQQQFREIGADEIIEDNSAAVTGADCGNLIIRFKGSLPLDPIFFSCHMDTVEPARGVKVQRTGDLFTSAGDTILGSDDKSALAACLEMMRVLKESGVQHRPVEFVITTCEEIGLVGAKALDPSLILAREGYALDSSGFARVIVQAPALERLTITVNGLAAHAGLNPELGINAITLAARALTACPCGRIDEETTANFGTISGGTADNIVSEQVVVTGEVRSHDPEKLKKVIGDIRHAFVETATSWSDPAGIIAGKPSVAIEVENDFPAMKIDADTTLIRRLEEASRHTGITLDYEKAGGGSDANVFNGYGLPTAIVATGMTNVHSTQEQVTLQDMVDLTRLITALVTAVSI